MFIPIIKNAKSLIEDGFEYIDYKLNSLPAIVALSIMMGITIIMFTLAILIIACFIETEPITQQLKEKNSLIDRIRNTNSENMIIEEKSPGQIMVTFK